MGKKTLFGADDLRKAGVAESLEREIIGSHISRQERQRHSITGISTLQLDEGTKDIFFKCHFGKGKDPKEIAYLQNFHLRDGTYLRIIGEEIRPSLVPHLFGSLANDNEQTFFLFMEYLGEEHAYKKYLSLAAELQTAERSGESDEKQARNLEERKLELLGEDLRHIARFNGLCNRHQDIFPAYMQGYMKQIHESQISNLPHYISTYLKRAVHYRLWGGKEFKKEKPGGKRFKSEKVRKRIQRELGIDLEERLRELFEFRQAFKYVPELAHGDCRLQHNFNGTFCDLDYFGYHPPYYDVAKYFSEEIATLPVSKLPSLLAYYLLYKRAYSEEDEKESGRMFEQLKKIKDEGSELEKMISERVGIREFADFVLGYLMETIEDNIIVNGSRKKFSPEELKCLLPKYPGYTYERLQKSRMDATQRYYHFITSVEAGPLFQNCSYPQKVAGWFFQMGKLLNDLSETAIDRLSYLEKIESGSQYTRFFTNGNGKNSNGGK